MAESPRTKAETALDAADQALADPQAGSYENAVAVALIGIGHALLEVARQIAIARP